LLRFFDFYGLRPQADACAICCFSANEMTDGIFFGREGLTCAAHKSNCMPLSQSATAAILHILSNPLVQSFQFTASPNVLVEVQNAAKLLWDSHFDYVLAPFPIDT